MILQLGYFTIFKVNQNNCLILLIFIHKHLLIFFVKINIKRIQFQQFAVSFNRISIIFFANLKIVFLRRVTETINVLFVHYYLRAKIIIQIKSRQFGLYNYLITFLIVKNLRKNQSQFVVDAQYYMRHKIEKRCLREKPFNFEILEIIFVNNFFFLYQLRLC